MTALLEVEHLTTFFRTPRGVLRAVDDVSFSLDRGRSLGIVGESGSGKTVLSRSIMGLLPRRDVVRRGAVYFDGADLSGFTPRQMRQVWGRKMAMIFQDPMSSLNPLMTIGRQVAEPLQVHLGLSSPQARERVLALLADVRLPDPERCLSQYPFELSGGMRQRVMIALAMACGPALLIADEPTTSLDVTVQAQILSLLGDQRREHTMAMILVTHDLGVVAGHTDEIAVMYGGRLVERAPTRELLTNLKMPYTEALLRSVPRLDQPSHQRLYAIPGRPPDLVTPPTGCGFAPRCPYARERCHREAPPLTRADHPNHEFACWYPIETTSSVAVRTFETNGPS